MRWKWLSLFSLHFWLCTVPEISFALGKKVFNMIDSLKCVGLSSCPGPPLDTLWICKWLSFIKWSSLFSLFKGKNFEQRPTAEPNFLKNRVYLQWHCQNIIINEEILFVQEILLAQQNGNCWRQTKLLSFVLYYVLIIINNSFGNVCRLLAIWHQSSLHAYCLLLYNITFIASLHLFIFKEPLEKFLSSQPLTIRKKQYGVYESGTTREPSQTSPSRTKSRSSTFCLLCLLSLCIQKISCIALFVLCQWKHFLRGYFTFESYSSLCPLYLCLTFGSITSPANVNTDRLEYQFLQSHRASNSYCEVRVCGFLAKLAG